MKKTLQTSDLKIGQKVWVDNLEKDCLEKWRVKGVTVNSVTVENKKSQEILRFHEKGGRIVLMDEETNLISYVLYTKRRRAKIALRKRCGITDLDIVLYAIFVLSFLDLRNGTPSFIQKNNILMPILAVVCVRHIYISIKGYLSVHWEDKIFLLISIIGRLIPAIKGDASDEYMWNYMMGQMIIMLLWLMLKGYRWIQWVSSEQEKKNDV